MIKPKYAIKARKKIRLRKSIRKKINGTEECPRLIVFRSNKYIYTQIVDDTCGKTLASASTLEKDIKANIKSTKDIEAAKNIGKEIAQRAKKLKIERVVFDRNCYPYIGRIKALADAARENGLNF